MKDDIHVLYTFLETLFCETGLRKLFSQCTCLGWYKHVSETLNNLSMGSAFGWTIVCSYLQCPQNYDLMTLYAI